MKKIVLLNVVSFITAIVFSLVSMLMNVSAFSYDFTTKSHLNLIIITRSLGVLFFIGFAVTLVIIIVSRKKPISETTIKKIAISYISLLLATSAITVLTVQMNYKTYGENEISHIQQNNTITYVNPQSEIDSKGVSLFGTELITFKAENVNEPSCVVDCLTTNDSLVYHQYLQHFNAIQRNEPEQLEYKGVSILKWHSVQNLDDYAEVLGAKLGGKLEINSYLIKDGKHIFYCENFKDISDNDSIDSAAEVENVYLIYTDLLNAENS